MATSFLRCPDLVCGSTCYRFASLVLELELPAWNPVEYCSGFGGVFLFGGTYHEAISSQDVSVEARLRACPVNLVTFPASYVFVFLILLLQKDVNLFVSN